MLGASIMRPQQIWAILVCVLPWRPEIDSEAWTDNMADAMNEVAWCYVEGFGCKKDKVWNHISSSFQYEPKLPNSFMRSPLSYSALQAWKHDVWLALAVPLMTAFWAAMRLSKHVPMHQRCPPRKQASFSRIMHHFYHSEGDEADHSQLQYAAAKYYRLAEQGGSKTLGNSW